MLKLSSEKELGDLSNAIITCKNSKEINNDQKPLILIIRKLKRFMTSDSDKITAWIYQTLKLRQLAMPIEISDPVNQALVDLLTSCISFQEAIKKTSSLDTLFDLIKKETGSEMTWLLCLIGEKLPQLVSRRIHEHLILGFASYGNPYFAFGTHNAAASIAASAEASKTSAVLFEHLINNGQRPVVVDSVIHLLKQYLSWIEDNAPLSSDLQQYTLSYLLSLPKISPALFEESWSTLFNKLYSNDTAGSMFLYESTTKNSLVKASEHIQDVATVFPRWLTTVAFDRRGVIMKHAMDVAIMLDTLAHDKRLNLTYLIPTGDKSIIDTLRPSFEQLDIKFASIDLVQWTISILSNQQRGVDDLKIPLFLLQLVVLKDDDSKQVAIDMFVQLITRLDRPIDKSPSSLGARYLALNLVSSAESKWPGIFQLVLENIFSKAIAMHIADSEGSVNIEKILGNLAMLFEPSEDSTVDQQPGFHAFQTYLTRHWRQVMLLFVNHPSMECRAMGYRVLTNSRFWENKGIHADGCDPHTISKLLVDAWFRHIKGRYTRFGQEKETLVVEEQQRLVAHCCQNIEIAKALLATAIDYILGGGLEIFPSTDINALQQEKMSLLDKVRQEDEDRTLPQSYQAFKPPQFTSLVSFVKEDGSDVRDKIYADNIERTAALFYQFSELPLVTPDQFVHVCSHILSKLATTWIPNTVALDTYDDVLPKNIPYQCDIAIGSSFKDHPVLFLILERYIAVVQNHGQFPTNDMIRSILVYFIVFWHMKEVVNVSIALKFATQLEETTRLIILLKPVLPEFLFNSYRVLPFMSARDLGDILFQVIWYYLRWHPNTNQQTQIPGIKVVSNLNDVNDEGLNEKCYKRLKTICENRLEILRNAPSWHQALADAMSHIKL